MHRNIEISIGREKSLLIQKDLIGNKYVIGIKVVAGASKKPEGDALSIHVLNRGADEVLELVHRHAGNDAFCVVTSEVASISDKNHQQEIDHDYDEAIWEEMETGLRHNGQLTVNYMLLMSIGGIIAAVGFISDIHTQIIAFIAASIIAPGLEPLAKIPLGIALSNKKVLLEGLRSVVSGYSVLIFSAGITFYLLQLNNSGLNALFLSGSFLHTLEHVKPADAILSTAAAAASIIMYLSYRRHVIAGPLIALIFIPAAASIGMCLSIGEWERTMLLLRRFGVDVALVIGMGLLFIYLKQQLVHRRKPIR